MAVGSLVRVGRGVAVRVGVNVTVGVDVIVGVSVGVLVGVAVSVKVGSTNSVEVGMAVEDACSVTAAAATPPGRVAVQVGGSRRGVMVAVGNTSVGGSVGGGKGLIDIVGSINIAMYTVNRTIPATSNTTARMFHVVCIGLGLPSRRACMKAWYFVSISHYRFLSIRYREYMTNIIPFMDQWPVC